MRSFRHRRGRNLFEVFAAFLIASGAAAGWISGGSNFLLIPTVIVSLYGLFRAVMLLARNPALEIDSQGLEIGRLFRRSKYRWDQVREMRAGHWRIDEDMPISLPSWVPAEREYLELMVPAGALDLGWIKLRTDLIEMPPGGVQELVELLRGAQVAAIGGRRAAMTRLCVDAAAKRACGCGQCPGRAASAPRADAGGRHRSCPRTPACRDGPTGVRRATPVFGRRVR